MRSTEEEITATAGWLWMKKEYLISGSIIAMKMGKTLHRYNN